MNPTDTSPILCGTDFSVQSAEAAEVAAALTRKLDAHLILVHAVDDSGLAASYPDILEVLTTRARTRLEEQSNALGKTGCPVTGQLALGSAARAVTSVAEREQARLVVVSSLGQIAPSRLLVGSVAERTAETASAPTLVVRRATDLLEWINAGKPLRIMVAIDFSESSLAALRWAKDLSNLAPCQVVAAHVDWPPEEAQRLGLSGSLSFTENPPLVREVLERDLRERVTEVFGGAEVRLRVVPGWGRTDHHLLELARAEEVDLLVVGSHQRQGLSRLRLGSVSRGILHHAPMNVAIVPLPRHPATASTLPKVVRVLVSTDLSNLGNRAIPHAYSLLQRGGTVQLVHVLNPPPKGNSDASSSDARLKEIAAALRRLIPEEAAERGLLTEIELLHNTEPALAIHQAAERFGADVICLSSHGKSGLSQALFGSVAQAVMKQTRRPVLVVRGTGD